MWSAGCVLAELFLGQMNPYMTPLHTLRLKYEEIGNWKKKEQKTALSAWKLALPARECVHHTNSKELARLQRQLRATRANFSGESNSERLKDVARRKKEEFWG
ncbi:uncharacterized protein LOC133295421 [Gastrolobium bilobum]|uniref:uncharacterized protein LOC133295421 n=1 Tax=Gastrolobium bilobum TaxID=150636 RepID=UPI002AAF3CE3|nr:uncharacterized protein LOC133295421 [Gastrolobium bilobum]